MNEKYGFVDYQLKTTKIKFSRNYMQSNNNNLGETRLITNNENKHTPESNPNPKRLLYLPDNYYLNKWVPNKC